VRVALSFNADVFGLTIYYIKMVHINITKGATRKGAEATPLAKSK